MTRQKAILKGISIVVSVAFFWTNCVWAGGLSSLSDYKLAAQTQLADVLRKANVIYTGTALHSALITNGIDTLHKLYEAMYDEEGEIKEYFRNELKKKLGDRLEGLKTLIFSDSQDPEKVAYYTFSPEGYYYRFTNAPNVNDPFYRLLRGYARTYEKGIEVPVNESVYYQEIITISPEITEVVETCLDGLYPEGEGLVKSVSMGSSRIKGSSSVDAKESIIGNIDSVISDLRNKGVSEDKLNNLKKGYENALQIARKRYFYADRIGEIPLQIKRGIVNAAEISLSVLVLDYDTLVSAEWVTGELLEEFSHSINNPKTTQEKAIEEFRTDIEQVLYFYSLDIDAQASYLSSFLVNTLSTQDIGFYTILLRTYRDTGRFKELIKILREKYNVSDEKIGVLEHFQKNQAPIFDLVLGYAQGEDVYPEEIRDYLRNKSKEELSEEIKGYYKGYAEVFGEGDLFLERYNYFRDNFYNNGAKTLNEVFETSLSTSIPPGLVVIGIAHLKKGNKNDDYLLSQMPRSPPYVDIDYYKLIEESGVEYVSFSGGGFGTCSLAKAFQEWFKGQSQEVKDRIKVLIGIIAPSTDNGGHTRFIADDVRGSSEFRGVSLPAVGDINAIFCWLLSYALPEFGKDRGGIWKKSGAKMHYLYDKNRFPGGDTLVNLARKNLAKIYNEVVVQKNAVYTSELPGDWLFYVSNMLGAVEILEERLPSVFSGKRKPGDSVKNLVTIAALLLDDALDAGKGRLKDDTDITTSMNRLLNLKTDAPFYASFQSYEDTSLVAILEASVVEVGGEYFAIGKKLDEKGRIFEGSPYIITILDRDIYTDLPIPTKPGKEKKTWILKDGQAIEPISGIRFKAERDGLLIGYRERSIKIDEIGEARTRVKEVMDNKDTAFREARTDGEWEVVKNDEVEFRIMSRRVEGQTYIADASHLSRLYLLGLRKQVPRRDAEGNFITDSRGWIVYDVTDEIAKILPTKYTPLMISRAKRGIYTELADPFTSTFTHFLTQGVCELISARKDIPRIYITKIMASRESEGLSLSEIIDVYERSIRAVTGMDIRFEHIFTDIIIPPINEEMPEEIMEEYLRVIREEGKKDIKKEAYPKLDMARTPKEVAKVIMENLIDETKEKLKRKEIKPGKFIPSQLVPVTRDDIRRLEARGLKVRQVRDASDFAIWENKIVYNPTASRKRISDICSFCAIVDWKRRFEAKLDPQNTEIVAVIFDRGDSGSYGFDLRIPSEITEENINEVVDYLMRNIYNRIAILGAETVKIRIQRKDIFEIIRKRFSIDSADIGKEFLDADSFLLKRNERGMPLLKISGHPELPYKLLNDYFRQISGRPFEVILATDEDINRASDKLQLSKKSKVDPKKGVLVGVDLGGTAIKVVVLKDGEMLHSETKNWIPKEITNADVHVGLIEEAIRSALNGAVIKESSLNAIGISWAGAIKDGKIAARTGTVDGGLSTEEFNKLKNLDSLISSRFSGVPTRVCNDGTTHGFAASVSRGVVNSLTFGMGTGLASSYIDNNGGLCPILSEMGNVIIDLSPGAARHTFTTMQGVLQVYLSQHTVRRLAEEKGIDLSKIPDYDKAKYVGDLFNSGDIRAEEVYRMIGRYIAIAAVEISEYLNIEHIFLSGGVTGGKNGDYMVKAANEILKTEYPNKNITIELVPNRRFSGAIGAAFIANQWAQEVEEVKKGVFSRFIKGFLNNIRDVVRRWKDPSILTEGAVVFDINQTLLLSPTRKWRETLKESPLRRDFIELLMKGFKVALVTGKKYSEIKERIINHIPVHLRENLIVYTNNGATKYKCDRDGTERICLDYLEGKTVDPEDVERIKAVIERALDEYWQNLTKYPNRYEGLYPTFDFRDKDGSLISPKVEYRSWMTMGDVAQITILGIPSGDLPDANLPKGQLDERGMIISKIMEGLSPELRQKYVIESAGVVSINITRRGINKAVVVRDLIETEGLRNKPILYFGDEFYEGGNDFPVRGIDGVTSISVGADQAKVAKGVLRGGAGVASTQKWIRRIIDNYKRIKDSRIFRNALGKVGREILYYHYKEIFRAIMLNIFALIKEKIIRPSVISRGILVFDVDDTLLKKQEKGYEETLGENPVMREIISLLEKGFRIAIITGGAFEGYEHEGRKVLGAKERIIDYIPHRLRKNLVVYVNTGAQKFTFDKDGNCIEDKAYHEDKYLTEKESGVLKRILEEAKDIYWKRFLQDQDRYIKIYDPGTIVSNDKSKLFKDKNGNLRNPIVRETRSADGKMMQVSIVLVPSCTLLESTRPFETGVVLSDELRLEKEEIASGKKLDERDSLITMIEKRIEEEIERGSLPSDFMCNIRAAGTVTIDLNKADKLTAMKDLLRSTGENLKHVMYFGDGFGSYGNDSALLALPELTCVDVGRKQEFIHNVTRGGGGIVNTRYWLGGLISVYNRFLRERKWGIALGELKGLIKGTKESIGGNIEEVIRDLTSKGSGYEIDNLRRGYNKAVGLVKQRYGDLVDVDSVIKGFKLRIKRGLTRPLEIGKGLDLSYPDLFSEVTVTIKVLKQLDRLANGAMDTEGIALNELRTDIETVLYFYTLPVEEQASYINNLIGDFMLNEDDKDFYTVLIRSYTDRNKFARMLNVLEQRYGLDKERRDILEGLREKQADILSLVLEYARSSFAYTENIRDIFLKYSDEELVNRAIYEFYNGHYPWIWKASRLEMVKRVLEDMKGRPIPFLVKPLTSSRRKKSSLLEAKESITGNIDSVISDLMQKGVGEDKLNNLRTGFNRALEIVEKRYPGNEVDMLRSMPMQIKHGLMTSAEVSPDVLILDYDTLFSAERVTGELLEEFSHSATKPQTPKAIAIEELRTDIEQIIYFHNLELEQQASYLYSLILVDTDFYTLLIRSYKDEAKFKQLLDILKKRYSISEDNVEILTKIQEEQRDILSLAIEYSRSGVYSPDITSLIKHTSEEELSEWLIEDYANYAFKFGKKGLFNEQYGFLKGRFYGGSNEHTLRAILNVSKEVGIPPVLVVTGILELDPAKPLDAMLISQLPRGPPYGEADSEYMYIGGGGFSACSLPRALVNLTDRLPYNIRRELAPYIISSLVTPYDDGGSSFRDQGLLEKIHNLFISSPGDLMSILAWATIHNRYWFRHEPGPNYKPEKHEAVMDMLYVVEKRIIVPEGKTIEDEIVHRLEEIRDSPELFKPVWWPYFLVNMRSMARIFKEELIDKGYMDYVRYLWQEKTSVQNLLDIVAILSCGKDLAEALKRVHDVLCVRKSYVLPVSDTKATLSAESVDGNVVISQTQISDPDKPYASINRLVFREGVIKDAKGNITNKGNVIPPGQGPEATSTARNAIKNVKKAIMYGMGSVFDSILPNLIVRGIPEALAKRKKEGLPLIYIPKLTWDYQTKGLSFKGMLLAMERSIQYATGDEGFHIQDIMSLVVIPCVPDKEKEGYIRRVLDEKKKYLNDDGLRKLSIVAQKIEDVSGIEEKVHIFNEEVVPIFEDSSNYNSKTINELKVNKTLKISKIVPGPIVEYTPEDYEFLEERGILFIKLTDPKAFRMWEGKINYDPDVIASILPVVQPNHIFKVGYEPRFGMAENIGNRTSNITAAVLTNLGLRGIGLGLKGEELKKKKEEADSIAKRIYENIIKAARVIMRVHVNEGFSRDEAAENFETNEVIIPDVIMGDETKEDAIIDVIEGVNVFMDNVGNKGVEELENWESGATSVIVTGPGVEALGNCPDYYADTIFTIVPKDKKEEFVKDPLDPEIIASDPRKVEDVLGRIASANNITINDLEVVLMDRSRETARLGVLRELEKKYPGLEVIIIKDGTVAHSLLATFGRRSGKHKVVMTAAGAAEGFLNLAVAGLFREEGAIGSVRIISSNINKNLDGTDAKDLSRRYDFTNLSEFINIFINEMEKNGFEIINRVTLVALLEQSLRNDDNIKLLESLPGKKQFVDIKGKEEGEKEWRDIIESNPLVSTLLANLSTVVKGLDEGKFIELFKERIEKYEGYKMRMARPSDWIEITKGEKLFTQEDVHGDVEGCFSFITNNGVFGIEGVKELPGGIYIVKILRVGKVAGRPCVWFEESKVNPLLMAYAMGMRVAYDYVDEEFTEKGGELDRLISEDKVAKVTSNPSILGESFKRGIYKKEIRELAKGGKTHEDIYDTISQRIVRKAAERFYNVYEGSRHKDGYVSIETNPLKANDLEATLMEARRLQGIRKNTDVKIAANEVGPAAIPILLGEGINMNVTLIFPGIRYDDTQDIFVAPQMEKILDAIIEGYKRYKEVHNGDMSNAPHVVLSLFLGRMDTSPGGVDKKLKALLDSGVISENTYKRLKGKAAVASTKLIYRIMKGKYVPLFRKIGLSDNRIPRLLLASTSAKEEYENTEPFRYIEPLIGMDIINTIPPKTYAEFKKSGKVRPNSIEEDLNEAEKVIKELQVLGIDLVEVGDDLHKAGLEGFSQAYRDSMKAILKEMDSEIDPIYFTRSIDHIMRMLGISDYPRIVQVFRTSVDPVAFVNELVKLSGRSLDEVLRVLESVSFFKITALDYKIRTAKGFNPSEFMGKRLDITVEENDYTLAQDEQIETVGEPLSDYISAKRAAAGSVPFVFRDEMEAFVGRFLGMPIAPSEKPDFVKWLQQVIEFFSRINLDEIRYVVTSGIGANEMYSHELAQAVNAYFGDRVRWIVVNNPAHLDPNVIPPDANNSNTVVFEMSRSGSTQETVDFFNATRDRFKKRIVAANSGVLQKAALELGKDPGAVILNIDDIPGDIGGRQMNRKTLMVYVPLFMALFVGTKDVDQAKGLLRKYVQALLESNTKLAYSNGINSPAIRLAELLLRHRAGAGRIKFALIWDPSLKATSRELFQLLNEGANKNIAGSTNRNILDSFSLNDREIYDVLFTRDPNRQMPIFLLNKNAANYNETIGYINQLRTRGIPCIVVSVDLDTSSNPNLAHNLMVLARTTNLLQDMVVYFTYLTNQDANSNPAVKFVREITAAIFEILKQKKESGVVDIRITLRDVMAKIHKKRMRGQAPAKQAVNRRDTGLAEYQAEFSEFRDAINGLAKNLGVNATQLTGAIIATTSKSVVQTDVGEAGGSKIAEIVEAFSRVVFGEILGIKTPDSKIDPLEKQIYIPSGSDRVLVSVAVEEDNGLAFREGSTLAEKIADYLYAMYSAKERNNRLTHMPLICMESDQENPVIREIVKGMVDRLADLGISCPKIALPGAAHAGIEAVMSHPENIFVVGIVSTKAYRGELGSRVVEGQVTVDDATYVYGIGNVVRMALGGSPSVVFEITDARDLVMVKDTINEAIRMFRQRIDTTQGPSGSHIVQDVSGVPEDVKEKLVHAMKLNKMCELEDVTEIPQGIEAKKNMLSDAMKELAKKHKGLGIFMVTDEVEIVRNLRADLYRQGRAPLAVYVTEGGIRKLKIDESAFVHPRLLYEELEHEFSESVARVVPGSNPAVSDVAATVINVRGFLGSSVPEQDEFLGILGQNRRLDPDGEYKNLLNRLRVIKGLSDNELIASVVRYVLRTKLYEHMRRELGLPDELAARIRDLEPRVDDALAVFNEIKKATQGEKLVERIKETEKFAISVVKTFNGAVSIRGLERLNHRLAGVVAAVVKIAGNMAKLGARLSEVKTDQKYCIVIDTGSIPAEMKADWEKEKSTLEKSQIFTIASSVEDARNKGFSGKQIIYLIDIHGLQNMEREKDILYLPMPYIRSSLYMAALVVVAGGEVNAIDPIVTGLVGDLYSQILGRRLEEAELRLFLERLFTAPWLILPEIQSVLSEINYLPFIAQSERAA